MKRWLSMVNYGVKNESEQTRQDWEADSVAQAKVQRKDGVR